MSMARAYLQTMRNEDGWTVRFGLKNDDESWTPLVWEGTDLRVGLTACFRAALKIADPSDDLPILTGLNLETFLVKSEDCALNWGLTLFRTVDYWMALTGYREQYEDREYATGAADAEIHLALGALKPARAAEAVPWRKDMKHRIESRNSEGVKVARDLEHTARRSQQVQAPNRAIREKFKQWDGHDKWTALLRQQEVSR